MMGYYMGMGDFYRGSERGDPFFGALAGLALGGITKLFRRGTSAVRALPGGAGGIMQRLPGPITRTAEDIGRMVMKHPVLSGAGAAAGIGAAGAMIGRHGMVPAGMRGFHLSKKSGKLVRNRRMRVTNPRALRRAIRRANGFARLARRVLHFTSPRAPRGRAIFKKRTRKKIC